MLSIHDDVTHEVAGSHHDDEPTDFHVFDFTDETFMGFYGYRSKSTGTLKAFGALSLTCDED